MAPSAEDCQGSRGHLAGFLSQAVAGLKEKDAAHMERLRDAATAYKRELQQTAAQHQSERASAVNVLAARHALEVQRLEKDALMWKAMHDSAAERHGLSRREAEKAHSRGKDVHAR